MSALSREEQIRLACLDQAVKRYGAYNTTDREIIGVAKEYEIYVRGIYVKGQAAPVQYVVPDDEVEIIADQIIEGVKKSRARSGES